VIASKLSPNKGYKDNMAKYRKRPVEIDAVQWFKQGDHPNVRDGSPVPGVELKPEQGWIPTLEGWHEVTPGDWIITGVEGENYPVKPDIFKKTYESCGE